MIKKLGFLFLLLILGACQQMGPTQMGVKFRKLPSPLGGVADRVIYPGELAVLMPWDSLYTFDTGVKDVSWPSGKRENGEDDEYVHTRARDGNEIALSVTIRYRLSPEPESLLRLLQNGASNDDNVRELVMSVARSYIRTSMNRLRTSEFLSESSRYKEVDEVMSLMQKWLGPKGIEVTQVILNDFRFERLLKDGTVDASYQEKLTEIQKLREDTERESLRIETVKAKKKEELQTILAVVNRQIKEADGFKQQAKVRGDAYYQAKLNEAKGILALGKAEVDGLIEQINALSGPGARAMLKLEISKQLQNAKPKFIVLDKASSQALTVQKIDTNDLLNQLGVLEGMKEKAKPQEAKLKQE